MDSYNSRETELLDLLDQQETDPASIELHEKLGNLLLSDAELRRFYVLRSHMASGLHWLLDPSAPAFVGGVSEPLPTFIGETKRIAPEPSKAFRRIAACLPGGTTTVGALLVLVILAAFWGLSAQFRNAREPQKERDEIEVARIRDSAETVWLRQPRDSEVIVSRDELLSIQSGVVELELEQGARLIVEGPAIWSIDGPNRATLKSGKLVARVERRAVGFTLDTPTAQFIDLGTEFGVEVRADGNCEMRVFEGQVEASSESDASRKKSATRLIEAGESVRVSNRGFEADLGKTVTSSDFVRSVPQPATKASKTSDRLIVSDDFAYPDGPLNRMSGGKGQWLGAWEGNGYEIRSGQAHLHTTNAYDSIRMVRPLAKTIPANAIYISARFRTDGSSNKYANWIRIFDQLKHDDADDAFTFGLGNGQFSAAVGMHKDGHQIDFGRMTPGQFHRLVAKCEFDVTGKKDRLTVWVDPTGIEQAEQSHSLEREMPFDSVSFVALRSFLATENLVDDLRIGTSWESVTAAE